MKITTITLRQTPQRQPRTVNSYNRARGKTGGYPGAFGNNRSHAFGSRLGQEGVSVKPLSRDGDEQITRRHAS